MTWPQNVGNRISEDLNFRGCPRTLLQGIAFGGPTIERPSVKSWIRPRTWKCLRYQMDFKFDVIHVNLLNKIFICIFVLMWINA